MIRAWLAEKLGGKPSAKERSAVARATRNEEEVKLARQMVGSGDTRKAELGMAMLSPRVARIVEAEAARKQDDPMTALMVKIAENTLTKNPLDQMTQMVTLLEMLRSFNDDGKGGESAWERFANSEAGAALMGSLGGALPQVLQANARNGQAAPATNGQLTGPAPSAPAPAPPDGAAGTTPEALLLLLEDLPPADVADYIMDWYHAEQERGETAAEETLDTLCRSNPIKLIATLTMLASSDNAWAPVARWLLEHPQERGELLAALRAQYLPLTAGPVETEPPAEPEPSPEEPEPEPPAPVAAAHSSPS